VVGAGSQLHLCAFLVFPYALYHLVPQSYVAVSWVGLAFVYYFLNAVIQNQKYRWMGHATLLLTSVYALFIGIPQLTSTQRVFSFLLLGSALIAVSVVFTRQRTSRRAQPPVPPPEESDTGSTPPDSITSP